MLDLDETLIHYDEYMNIFRTRPFCYPFLTDLAPHYEIVIFTAAEERYANFIIDKLDTGGDLIKDRLFRQHLTRTGYRMFIKDLERLDRPLNRCLIIDNLSENFEK